MWGREGSGGSDASERGVLRERADGAARVSASERSVGAARVARAERSGGSWSLAGVDAPRELREERRGVGCSCPLPTAVSWGGWRGVSDGADGEGGGGGASGVVRRPEPRTGIERRGEEGAALWAAQSGAAGAARVQGGSRAEGGGEVVVDHWWLELREAGGGHLGDRRRRWRSLWRPLS